MVCPTGRAVYLDCGCDCVHTSGRSSVARCADLLEHLGLPDPISESGCASVRLGPMAGAEHRFEVAFVHDQRAIVDAHLGGLPRQPHRAWPQPVVAKCNKNPTGLLHHGRHSDGRELAAGS